jgi:iron complex outermembrane receptor protein
MRISLLLFFALIISGAQLFAQSTITGKILDSKTKEPLIGATVVVKGTTTAASASLDGSFKLKVPAPGSGVLVFTYIGYISKEISISATKNVGSVLLESNASSLSEVVINSTVIDRKTPIAVSTVNAEFIEEKGAGQEFPELLKESPGVMATRTGGGYGDSRVSIRGFSNSNVALLINGIPVNDVETGRIFWNDWAGLADVTSSMQVQRGLGASKVAAPSLGGTIGITTRSTDVVPGGYLTQSIGSYGDTKTAVSVSSGLTNKGWATSFMLARRVGDGNAEGLYYSGYSYFFNLSKVLSKTQNLSFNVMGATQSHGQRFTYNSIQTYRISPQGERYNGDYGFYNGQVLSAEQNYYNKPLAALNHNWTINESTQLATVAYASFGLGAARYMTNTTASPYQSLVPGADKEYPRTGDIYSPIDFNQVVKNNLTSQDGSAQNYFQNVTNDHQQYGVLSTLKKRFGESIDLIAGIDGRYYEGQHYYTVQDLLGAQYLLSTADLNSPNYHAKIGDKFNRNYQFDIASEGLFLQAEYSKNSLSAFLSLAASNTGNKRVDYFSYLANNPDRESKYVNFLGYQAKGGANYNIDKHNNVFFNIGVMQRAPLVASIFLNNNNTLNPNAVPEKLFSYELGYGYRSSDFTANVNLYRSTYRDRSVTPKVTIDPGTGAQLTTNLSGLNELHQGVEIDAKYRPVKEVQIRGMLSIGDWHYISNAGPAQVTSDNPTVVQNSTQAELIIKGLKVGDAAQTTASLGLDVNILPKVKVGTVYNYYARYTAYYNPANITHDGYQAYQVPNYSLFDLNGVFRFTIAGLDGSFIANVNNLFDTKYIGDAYDQAGNASGKPEFYQNTASTIGVFYGIGRTYTTTLRIKF